MRGHMLLKAYRPEIDGLRAIAIGTVVIYHADIALMGQRLFPGGFLGVDVFFVISGYLITSIVLSEVKNGTWSLVRFYERRARRILPALFAMIAVAIPFAWWLMSPAQMENFGSSALATVLFGSNFFFWLDTGYFSEAIDLKPLAHTWSLAVEEQFYLVLPLLVWGLARLSGGRYLVAALTALAIASLAWAQWLSAVDTAANFYLLPSRGWELLAGSLLAWLETKRERPAGGRGARITSLVGLGIVVVSAWFVDGAMPHPGLVTVPVVFGTVLLIWFGGAGGPTTWLLTRKVVVGIGLISYSLYLWHQPVFSFARLYSINALTTAQSLALIAISVVLAILSWRYVERPFRQKGRVGKFALWSGSAAASVVVLAWSTNAIMAVGWPERMPAEYRHLAFVERGYWNDNGEDCLRHNCKVGDDVAPTVALVGDSHAAMLAKSFDRLLEGSGKAVTVLADGDVYVSSYPAFYPQSMERLSAHNQVIFSPEIDTVVLSSRAVLRVSNRVFDNGEGGVEGAEPRFNGRTPEQREEFKARIRDGIEGLLDAGKRVVLVYPVPEVGWDVPTTLAKVYARGGTPLSTSEAVYRERSSEIIALYDGLGERENLLRVYPEDLFCHGGRCEVADAESIFYLDDDHLSVAGANRVVSAILAHATEKWGGI